MNGARKYPHRATAQRRSPEAVLVMSLLRSRNVRLVDQLFRCVHLDVRKEKSVWQQSK